MTTATPAARIIANGKPSENGAHKPAQTKTLLSYQILKGISEHADLIAIHPEVASVLAPNSVDSAQIERARETGQGAFVMVRFHEGTPLAKMADSIETIYAFRGKEVPVSDMKVRDIAKNGFMIIPEDHLVRAIYTFAPKLLKQASVKTLTAAD